MTGHVPAMCLWLQEGFVPSETDVETDRRVNQPTLLVPYD